MRNSLPVVLTSNRSENLLMLEKMEEEGKVEETNGIETGKRKQKRLLRRPRQLLRKEVKSLRLRQSPSLRPRLQQISTLTLAEPLFPTWLEFELPRSVVSISKASFTWLLSLLSATCLSEDCALRTDSTSPAPKWVSLKNS